MTITVLGAGMAGLLTAAVLRNRCGAVIEKATELPNNHSAVLRFRTTSVADALNIPFKKVKVLKASHGWRNPIADSLAYSFKVNSSLSLRSITSANSQETVERYIAPPGFIGLMMEAVTANFKFGVDAVELFELGVRPEKPKISTLPMPTLMAILDYQEGIRFGSIQGVNLIANIERSDVYCSLYISDPEYPFSRISIEGDKVIAEMPYCWMDPQRSDIVYTSSGRPFCIQQITEWAAFFIGVNSDMIGNRYFVEQKYAKIRPIDDDARKRFILWATENYNVYSVGRYATWRPGLLLDDVVNDIRVVTRLIDGQSSYEHRKGL